MWSRRKHRRFCRVGKSLWELEAGHVSLVSHPKEIADLIRAAAGRRQLRTSPLTRPACATRVQGDPGKERGEVKRALAMRPTLNSLASRRRKSGRAKSALP